MQQLTPRPATSPGLEVNEAEDGLVVYVEETDTVHYLNRTASVIFGLCDGTRDAEALAAELAALFELDELPLDETNACLEQLASNGLIG